MHQIPELGVEGLRRFGLLTGALVVGLFGLLLPWLLGAESLPIWPWPLAGVLILWALLHPAGLRQVYRLWMRLGLVIGGIMSPLLLGIVFFVLILPFGMVMRLFREDPMQRSLNDDVESYRVRSHSRDVDHMERPF